MNSRVFVDTNVLLDVLAFRKEFYESSAGVWLLAEQDRIQACISVISFTNIYYIIRKLRDRQVAEQAVSRMRDLFIPVPLDASILNQAIDAGFEDFEDAVQYASAVRAAAQSIISRNPEHFPNSPELPVVSPAEFLVVYRSKAGQS